MRLRDAVGGVLVGLAASGATLLAADFTGEPAIAVIPLLAVALVGLTLGAIAALWTYGIAGVVIIVQAVLLPDNLVTTANIMRITAFIVGAPLLVILSLRAERERRESRAARDLSVAAERAAVSERAAADAARRELQAALRQVEQQRTRLEEVAEAIPEPLIVYDGGGRGTYANRAALRTFGRSFYDRSVDEWARLARPRDERGQPLSPEEWPQVRARREVVRRRLLVHLPMSGRDLLVDVEGTPVPDGGCVLMLRDVGKEVDERRRLSRFASFVAHELRNPLAVAKARMELAARELEPSTRASTHGLRALESVDAAIGILERLELFSRAEAGRLESADEGFDLEAAARAAIERLRARGSDRKVQLSITGELAAHGDRPLTEQAITNLLINADRYSTEGQPIRVEISGGTAPELRVCDAGPGVADDMADVIFRDRVSSGRGLGLGLYLVRAAMEAQGGVARLEERRPGAVFLLRWPDRAGEHQARNAAVSSAAAGE